jgi:hypothetical protein
MMPSGRILYEANGQMSAQLMRPEMTAFVSDDPLRATDGEAALAWRNCIGYWGTYTINARAGIITHHIEGAWLTNRVGQSITTKYMIRFVPNLFWQSPAAFEWSPIYLVFAESGNLKPRIASIPPPKKEWE